MRVLARIAAWALALGLICLAACASGPSNGDKAAPAAAPPAKPVSGPLPATPPGPAGRVCLWVFWTNNSTLMDEAQALLKQGEPFQTVALTMVRNNKDYATTQADCLQRDRLPPAMTAAVKDLNLGQVSGPFPLNKGTALAMLTSDAFRRKAKELYSQGKYNQAVEQLKLDLELHPAAAASWHLLALCQAATGDRAGALKSYDQALAWTPDDPAVLNDKATLLTQMGRGGQALVLYRRALAITPNDPVFMNNLAWALVQQKKDLDQALELAKRAAALAPDNPAVWDTMGQVQQARGDHAGAVTSFHRAARLDPQAAGVKDRMLASLLALKGKQLDRLSRNGAPAPTEAKPKPAPRPEPQAKPAPPPQPAPTPEPKPQVKPEAAPPGKPAPPMPKPQPQPQSAPEPKAEPKPTPITQSKAEAAPEPHKMAPPLPKPKPAPAPPQQAKPAAPARAAASKGDEGRPPQGWYLQLASNRKAALARQARDAWAAKGHPALVYAWRSPKSGLWHRLLIGPFPTKLKALVRGDMLKQAGEIKTYVLVKIP